MIPARECRYTCTCESRPCSSVWTEQLPSKQRVAGSNPARDAKLRPPFSPYSTTSAPPSHRAVHRDISFTHHTFVLDILFLLVNRVDRRRAFWARRESPFTVGRLTYCPSTGYRVCATYRRRLAAGCAGGRHRHGRHANGLHRIGIRTLGVWVSDARRRALFGGDDILDCGGVVHCGDGLLHTEQGYPEAVTVRAGGLEALDSVRESASRAGSSCKADECRTD